MSKIVKVVPVPMTLWTPMLSCGHAGPPSTFKETVGKVGDEQECLVCRQEGKKS